MPASSRPGEIASALREAIIAGDIPAGEQLRQDELSAHFGVSPGPVREALRQLESDGLVEHYPNRGAFVTRLSVEEALEVLLPVRLLLESYALSRTSKRLTAELIAQLEGQIAIMQEAGQRGDVAAVNHADARFHELAVSACGSPHAVQLWRSVLPRIRLQFYRLTPRHSDLRIVAEEHRRLLDALRGGSSDAIEAVLREHIVGTISALMSEDAAGPGE